MQQILCYANLILFDMFMKGTLLTLGYKYIEVPHISDQGLQPDHVLSVRWLYNDYGSVGGM